MAKKKGPKTPSDAHENGEEKARSAGDSQSGVDQTPEVHAAKEAVRRAEAELAKAGEFYSQIRQQAVDQLKRVRETTVADMLDGTLKLVKKHPGPSVLIAAVIGFFLGRLFRR